MNEIKEFESNPGLCTQTIEMLASSLVFSARKYKFTKDGKLCKIKIIFCPT